MSRLLPAAVLLSLSACVIGPYSGQVVSSSSVPFEGFANSSGAQVIIEAYNWGTASFEYVGSTVAATNAIIGAGTFCSNSPDMFLFNKTVTLNSGFWKLVNGKNTARVRASQIKNGNLNGMMFTANPAGAECMTNNANTRTCDFYAVAYNTCGYKLSEATITR